MAFWGIEVKPGKPFTQKFDDFKGRLHVSLATLGFGSAANKSVLQCNIGNKSPIYLCSLLPTKVECLQLNLEFEEADDVVFSVIGPRSIHISGYFLGRNQHTVLNNDSESYGEDIANTETEGSVYGDDEYEDSFINDDDPEILPPSPVSIRGKVLEKKTKSGLHRHRRLKKKYQLDESDDQGRYQQNDISDVRNTFRQSESDEDNSIPISAFFKGRANVIHSSPETKRNHSLAEICNRKAEANDHSVAEVRGKALRVTVNDQPSRKDMGIQLDADIEGNQDKKLLEKAGNDYMDDSDKSFLANTTKLEEARETSIVNDPCLKREQEKMGGSKHGSEPDTMSFASIELFPKEFERPKKKKKGLSKEGNIFFAEPGTCHPIKENRDEKVGAVSDCMGQDLQFSSDQTNNQNSVLSETFQATVDKNIKKKKNSKKGDTMDVDVPIVPSDKKTISAVEVEDKNENYIAISTQTRKLNGVIIEELKPGMPEGKVAVAGKKVSVTYTGKLKKTGEIIESNNSGNPFKFRLGVGKVIKGWDVGIDGMVVGERRRITIPPSMGFGQEGHGGKVSSNSWLIYEIELVKADYSRKNPEAEGKKRKRRKSGKES